MKLKRIHSRNTPLFGIQLRYGVPAFVGFTVLISGLNAHAGDILRGGRVGSNTPGTPGAAGGIGTATPAATDAARANAMDSLARTTRALDAVRAMQVAARNAAINGAASPLAKPPATPVPTLPSVPNGLTGGGLQVAPVVATDPTKWSGAQQPTQTNAADGSTQVTVKQTTQQALLNWQTLNVGKQTTLTFDQSAGGQAVGQWIAFNKVSDPTGNPTQILGSIKADGQVYVINPNGVIFGGSSQVNARNLTVSSLPVNANLIDRGLLNNPDAQFLFSGLALPAGINGTDAFTPEAPLAASGKYGDVTVEAGAVLVSPTNAAKVGGRITLVGPNVSNNGSISTPDGQTILAAGLQVGFDGHASSDPSLRGLDVFVGAVTDPLAGLYAGTASQGGLVEAARGNITLAGREINQGGGLVSSTSVSLNGRIDLQAQYNAISNRTTASARGALFLFKDTGAVNLGAGSVMSILPEYASLETTIGTELALRSQVNALGKTIRMGTDSLLSAPNATVSLTAGKWLFDSASPPISTFVQSGGQMYLESGAQIDVSGSRAVPVSVSQNIVAVDLRSAELADSPLQRLGILRNATVQVDIRNKGDGWIGTPLADVSGFANLIQRTVGQLTVAGGSVTINAGASVVMQNDSKINVSGGSTLFTGGMVRTTQLLTGGRLVDIGSASPDVVYDGIYDGSFTEVNAKFGVANVFGGVLVPAGNRYEAGYTQGAAGGKLSLVAPSMALDGSFAGVTVAGDNQRLTPPAGSTLALAFQAQDLAYPDFPIHSPAPPTVTFNPNASLSAAEPFAVDANGDPLELRADRKHQVVLSPELLADSGFGALTIDNHDGAITVPAGVELAAPSGGSISFKGSTITIDSSVSARGGSLSFATYGVSLDQINLLQNSPPASTPPAVPAGRGIFTLGAGGRLIASGLVVDDRESKGGATVSPLALAGGAITILGYTVNLASGGSIDVAGGAVLNGRGGITYGNGGSLSITAGREPGFSATLGGALTLAATLQGYSGAKAGMLKVTGSALQIGGTAGDPRLTVVEPETFAAHGFGNISLSGVGLAGSSPAAAIPGLLVIRGTTVRPLVSGWLGSVSQEDAFTLTPVLREETLRSPAQLTLAGIGASFGGAPLAIGEVRLEEGSSILTDAGGAVVIKGQTVTLRGAIVSPGGSITVSGASAYPTAAIAANALPTVHLASSAVLSTAGTTVLVSNPYGRRAGKVFAGGSIAVAGNIIAEAGAILDVSGASGTLDLPPNAASLDPASVNSEAGKRFVPVTVETAGGAITLTGSEMLFTDATLLGRAGGSSAGGGLFSLTSGRFVSRGDPYTTADPNLAISQDAISIPATNGSPGVGVAVLDANGGLAAQQGYFSMSRLVSGGFDSVSLGGNVRFEGDVSIHVPGRLAVATGGVVYATGAVDLSAGQVVLGQDFRTPTQQSGSQLFTSGLAGSLDTPAFSFKPTYGSGALKIAACLVDIGDLSLQGIGTTLIGARDGDVRGNDTFQMAGDLTIEAGQIYPPTQRRFDVFVYDYAAAGTVLPGSVSIYGGTTRPLPLSAGGTLSIYATEITQGGTLRAPIGRINLGWDGTGSGPINPIAGTTLPRPVTSHLTLAAGGLTSVAALDPVTGKGVVIPYGISQDGKSWIDPAGNDITVSGPPAKAVNLAAVDVVTAAGSTIDISGGGDLYAYRWIPGNGGSEDILAAATSFAVIPGYGFNYSPYAPFNSDSSATSLGGAPGFTNASLRAGDQITLAASKDLPAGTYTLLPARYALLPGAVLVTPKATVPVTTLEAPDGSSLVAGYRSNNLDASRTGQTLIGGFEIAAASVIRARAEYQDLLGNTVLREAAISRASTIPRLPVDAGYLAFSSTSSMALLGRVASLAPASGRGSLIDISSVSDILINPSGTAGSGAGLVLSAQTLNSFGAESLLIGGLRSFNSNGASVTANASVVTLDNAGAALTGNDVILVSRNQLTIEAGSQIIATKDDVALDTVLIGNDGSVGSGNGSLVRVSANATGRVSRSGVSSSGLADFAIRAGAELTGGAIVLDSTAGTRLADSARLLADDVFLNSGQISVQLNNPGVLNPTSGLVIGGEALASLQNSAKRLALLSYSTLDVYGTGTIGSRTFESLSIQASSIRGFNAGGGSATFAAASLALGNGAASAASTPLPIPLAGSLTFDADQITLGANAIRVDGYAGAVLAAGSGILTEKQGSLDVAGTLNLVTPLLTGASASKYQIRAAGAFELARPAVSGPAPLAGGFGADLTLQGAGVNVNGDITLPSGRLTLHATAGDLVLGATATASLDLAGTSTRFIDTIRYTGGGTVNLLADTGSVRLETAVAIDVSAKDGGGDAGAIQVQAPGGSFDLKGSITGSAGGSGNKGQFTLDAGTLAGGSLAGLDAILNTGSFTQSRDYRIRAGNVTIDGPVQSNIYRVSADGGNIVVSNIINASGATGGLIDLKANGSLTLGNGAVLDAAAAAFDSAGKGGAVTLEAGAQRNGIVQTAAVLDLQTGSTIKLAVAAATAGSEALGKFSGTLHLRAPRTTTNTGLQVNPIGSLIDGASSILVEGVKLYDLSGTGIITSTVQNKIKTEANTFLGNAGTTTAGYSDMLGSLTSLQPSLNLILAPGAEIFNSSGDLVLGTTTSTATSDWNLESFRFGPKAAAGVLTLRASGDIIFYNALSDGFAAVTPNSNNGQSSLWLAPLMARNNLLPANTQAWTYRFTSGADLSSADYRAVLAESQLASGKGSFLLGKNYGNAATFGSGDSQTTAKFIANRYQVIRTGSGDISINSARNAYILNQFASIYTAGTVVSDPGTVLSGGDFVVPLLLSATGRHPNQGALGAVQQPYFVQYSMAGGNVSICAAGDIARMTRNSSSATGGTLINDSSRQLPSHWLYRRGYIDPSTGRSGVAGADDGSASLTDPDASTTWWVDFSNFFEGVGTLGGGNIKLTAGNDVRNIDALAPTNARMAGGKPAADAMVELGGGDVTVLAGRNIDGGVYYVERGKGILRAGNEITTNSTRSPSRGIIESLTNPVIYDSNTWLPTTLVVGKGGFDVQAGGDMLLGPTVNAFLLPQGLNNKFWYKTYFSTYAAASHITATSLGGSVTLRTAATLPSEVSERPILAAWMSSQYSLSLTNSPASFQPWLRLAETAVSPFQTLSSLMAPRLAVYALTGGINLAGNLTLWPSPQGQLELVASQSIVGLQATGFVNSTKVERWVPSTINVSDSDPNALPGITSPYAYLQAVGRPASAQRVTGSDSGAGFLDAIDARFIETGSSSGVLEEEQARHTQGLLHSGDIEPVRVYALNGNIEGFTLFSPKATRISSGLDLGDIGFYLQNVAATDVSVVSAGRDLTPYNATTGSRAIANAALASNSQVRLDPLAGDIQISGPGSLQVLAGRNLDLGLGSGNADGTGAGITSIGNGRNPYLSFGGASLLVGAGIGPASSLAGSNLGFESFISQFASAPAGTRYLAEAKGVLGVLADYDNSQSETRGIKVKSVTPGGAADQAGVKAGDVLLKISDKEIASNYDDSCLVGGLTIGQQTKLQLLRDGKPLELDITPGSNALDLADPLLTPEARAQLALSIFYLVLRDTGRDFNDPGSPGYRNYDAGFDAIKALFPGSSAWDGSILTQSRDIRTRSGGNINIFAPGGGMTMANTTIGNPLTPPGVVTEAGGDIALFTDQSVGIGIGRIFTLKGGNAAIWSSKGDIAAGSSSRTVSAAPPTRVVIDPQSASVETDLAGLATGGGIGVLATVAGVAPGNVDLIAPTGVIDAGDAGIRVSGNINLAAVTVVNAGNISAAGTSTGAPAAGVSAPSISTVTTASNASAAAATTVANPAAGQAGNDAQPAADGPSIFTVEVLGYGGGADEDENDENADKPAQ